MTMKEKTNKSDTPRLLLAIRDEIGPKLQSEFGYSSVMEIPVLNKVIISMGLGEALTNKRAIENATKDLMAITGQKPITTKAKKSIAGFKLREGMPIGIKVTLRGKRMYEFVDRLLNATLPRIRDFQGISRNSFDGRGNCSIGIKEHAIFPEIDYNSIDKIRGMQVVLVTSAKNDQEGMRFLELAGMPFVRNQ
jgi:large subunit ribosomal protein L5